MLLLLGGLFLAGLAFWELRKSRRGGRGSPAAAASEPKLSLPELPLPELHAREAPRQLPVVEIAAEVEIDLTQQLSPEQAPGKAVPRVTGSPEDSLLLVPEAFAASFPPPDKEVIVDWPPESERRLVGVRLVAPLGERYSGRALRQALAAAGLRHGKFGIFHRTGPDARAVFSVASLTKPGHFDLDAMDAQRYSGLSLFAVLPGPLPPAETIDSLLATARELAERLGGALQDERGQPLSPARIGELRAGVEGRAA